MKTCKDCGRGPLSPANRHGRCELHRRRRICCVCQQVQHGDMVSMPCQQCRTTLNRMREAHANCTNEFTVGRHSASHLDDLADLALRRLPLPHEPFVGCGGPEE